MNSPISLIVRIVAAGYILYKLWWLIINDRLGGLWVWIFHNVPERTARKTDTSTPPPIAKTSAGANVVGRTNTVYLEDPRITAPVPPAMSQPLEPSGFIGEETEPSSEEVEVSVAPTPVQVVVGEPASSDDTGDDGALLDEDFDRCLTFEQMNEAMDVLACRRTEKSACSYGDRWGSQQRPVRFFRSACRKCSGGRISAGGIPR